MSNIKRVIDYSGLDYYKALELPCDIFQLMVKNSVIDDLNKTPEGKEYLAKCKRLRVTEPEINKLDKIFGIKQG